MRPDHVFGNAAFKHGVDRASVLSGRYELEVATMRVPVEVFLNPLCDPTNARIKS